MFKNLFTKKEYNSKTGFFKVDKEDLIPIDELEKGSINDCIKTIGFPTNHIYTIHTSDSNKISCLGFTTLTRKLQFVLSKNPQIKISYSDALKASKNIDWDFEYSDLNVEDILQEGIESENFDLEFVKSILDLNNEDKNLYKSNRFGLFLHFENDILKAFSSSEWENSSTKWLRGLNQKMIENMTDEAKQYHRNEIEAMEEVNSQTKAFMNVPNAMRNEYLSLHKSGRGNINFFNLVIAHYTKDCGQDEFLFMNKGRFEKTDDQTFRVGNYNYEFDNNKVLIDVYGE